MTKKKYINKFVEEVWSYAKEKIMTTLIRDNVERFFSFMEERHAIYLRRERGDPWPWTNDLILQQYKFTNVFRELDVGTIYCREKIREPYAKHPELFFNVAAYRLFNWIGTWERIGFIETWNRDTIDSIIRGMKSNGEQIFTGAHMITGTLGGDKIHQVVDVCLDTLWKNRRELEPKRGDTLETAFKRLCKHNPGYGPFIAYEVITDLRWTRYLQDASDILTWANPGPGCMRGINRLANLPARPKKQMSTSEYLQSMRVLLKVSGKMMNYGKMPLLEMREIEHSLCEWDKHERTRLGQGRPRSKFIPPHERLV